MRQVREICDKRGILLILDEIQTGMGRTGALFAYEQSGIEPDIMTLAKGLGAGVPIGAMLATEEIAGSFDAGSHGSTFGGNALTCATAIAVMDVLLHDGVLENCREQGAYLAERVNRIGAVKGTRGAGLLLGAELDRPGQPIVEQCREDGLLINCTAERILRLSPPLIVSREEVDEAVEILEGVLKR
jgi:acetylornithine/succinyldiaminopimelate/putrescine aminotransferase